MSELPPFDQITGYLPPGWHPASPKTLRDRCIDPLALLPRHKVPIAEDSLKHREKLFSGYQRLHEALSMLCIPTEQWIGGPFVSCAALPPAVNVVNFCDAFVFEGLPNELRALVINYLRGEESVAHCHCDSHLVAKGPPDHPCNADFLKMFNFWHKLLGHDSIGRPRGIVGITIEPPQPPEEDDEPAA